MNLLDQEKVLDSKLIEFIHPYEGLKMFKVVLYQYDEGYGWEDRKFDPILNRSLIFLNNEDEFIGEWDSDMGGGMSEEMITSLDDDEVGYIKMEEILVQILHPKFPGFFSDLIKEVHGLK